MRNLIRILLLPLVILAGAELRGQVSLSYNWLVTHDKKLVTTLTATEGVKTSLDTQLAVHRGIESSLWSTATGAEAYSWMRSYAQFLRVMRSFERVRESIMLTKIPVWTLMPQIGFVAPVEYKDPVTGKSLVAEKEVASISVVPPAYQAHWTLSNFFQDDEVSGAGDISGKGKPLITFKYPHDLSDVQLTFSPSPFLSDYAFDESQAIDDMKAHFFEALMDASARLAGFGVQINPLVLASGEQLVEGRVSPAQLKLQALIYEKEALDLITKIHRLYIDHGTSFPVADRLVKRDRAFWDGFGSRMEVLGNAKVMFAMNLMNEVHQTIGRLEAYQRRAKVAETDEALVNLGKKRLADGTWGDFLAESKNFWDMVDRIAKMPNQGQAIKLQAMGLSARYSRFQFDEVEGLRNILMGSERMKIALYGLESEKKQRAEIEAMNKGDFDGELYQLFSAKRDELKAALGKNGWGGMRGAVK